jgi:hypothetical protein
MEKIAELMLRREFEKKGKQLPAKFWNLPEYKIKFRTQCMMAAKFLRTFDKDVIIKVLEKEKWCFSLAAKILPNKFEIEQNKKNLQKEVAKIQEAQKTVDKKQENTENVPSFRTQKRKTFKQDG